MRSVLVTGGTGTFGRAFIRQCLTVDNPAGHPRLTRVVAYSRDEVKQAALAVEFGYDPRFRAFLGDVRDYDRLRQACQGIECVVAAAALKRVDATAYNPTELLKTNVNGVETTIRAAVDAGVKRVVVISSDKAVAPSNPYGVSKAMAETIAVTSNTWAYPRGCHIAAIRYGNVLASRGSVIETWRKQAATGQRLSITDPRMTRFVMTIEHAVVLVRDMLNTCVGGEIIVPKLPSASIETLARAVGGDDCALHTIGLRPGGEKLHESLLAAEEIGRTVDWAHNTYCVQPAMSEWTPYWSFQSKLPEGFVYRSDVNPQVLTVAEVRALLEQTRAGE